jgi:hypothetical protein
MLAPELDGKDTKLCRNSRGVHSMGLSPAAVATRRLSSTTRGRLCRRNHHAVLGTRRRHRPGTAGHLYPAMPPGEEIEVTALWDIRSRRGEYVITMTAALSGRSLSYGRTTTRPASTLSKTPPESPSAVNTSTANASSRRSRSARCVRSTAWAFNADRRAACLTDCRECLRVSTHRRLPMDATAATSVGS